MSRDLPEPLYNFRGTTRVKRVQAFTPHSWSINLEGRESWLFTNALADPRLVRRVEKMTSEVNEEDEISDESSQDEETGPSAENRALHEGAASETPEPTTISKNISDRGTLAAEAPRRMRPTRGIHSAGDRSRGAERERGSSTRKRQYEESSDDEDELPPSDRRRERSSSGRRSRGGRRGRGSRGDSRGDSRGRRRGRPRGRRARRR